MKKHLAGASRICEPVCSHALTGRVMFAALLLATAFLLSQCGGMLNGVGAGGGGGYKPNAVLSVQSLSFDSQTNPFGLVTLTNSGKAPLNVSGVTVSAQFSEHNGCIPIVAPGASCLISLSFTPQTTGTFAGTLSISDDAPGGVQTVSLSGVGATGNTNLTGTCFGTPQVPIGPPTCTTDQSATAPSQCVAGNPAITPVNWGDPTCGPSGLVDLSTRCQFTDVHGTQFNGSCEAQ